MEHVHSLTVWNRAGTVFSGHRSEACNHLREPRKVLEEKKEFDEGCCNDSPVLCVLSKTAKEWMQYSV